MKHLKKLKRLVFFLLIVISGFAIRFYLLPEAVKEQLALSGMADRYFAKSFSKEETVNSFLYEGFFYPIRYFNKDETQELLSIVNDSSSYLNGELATVDFNRQLYFQDKMSKTTLLTLIGQDGQTQSYPLTTSTRKYGLLNTESEKKFIEIIKN